MDSLELTVDIIIAVLTIATLAGMWATFEKAGEAGFLCLIPIFNAVILLRIVGRSALQVLLLFIPLVNLGLWLLMMLDLAGRFGKGALFGIGLTLLPFVFLPILGFSGARYQEPD
jgi:hypothetical protein